MRLLQTYKDAPSNSMQFGTTHAVALTLVPKLVANREGLVRCQNSRHAKTVLKFTSLYGYICIPGFICVNNSGKH